MTLKKQKWSDMGFLQAQLDELQSIYDDKSDLVDDCIEAHKYDQASRLLSSMAVTMGKINLIVQRMNQIKALDDLMRKIEAGFEEKEAPLNERG
jgi:hypothetical protein